MSVESQRVYLAGKMAQLSLGIPVAMPNQPFSVPVNAPYAEFHIMGTKPIPIGGEGKNKLRERHVGIIQLTIWIPEGKGTKGSATAADKFGDKFKHKNGRDAEGCTYIFKGCEVTSPSTKVGWSCQIARIPFHRDEIAAVGGAL